MRNGQGSETAYRAARARARHQVLDVPRVFEDPYAARLLRADDALELAQGQAPRGGPLARGMRMALAVRSRIAEDALHEAVARGVRQYVVLGAGFDTFAFRNPYPAGQLSVFEVDHPDTQAAKRERIAGAGLEWPRSLHFVPVDFSTHTLAAQLDAAGFRAGQPAFFAFLGVSVYLEAGALEQTLAYIAGCQRGSEVVFDYVVTPQRLGWLDRFALKLAALRCARLGEPWKLFLDPEALHARLKQLGFSSSQDFGAPEIQARLRESLPAEQRVKPPRFGMGRLAWATV